MWDIFNKDVNNFSKVGSQFFVKYPQMFLISSQNLLISAEFPKNFMIFKKLIDYVIDFLKEKKSVD